MAVFLMPSLSPIPLSFNPPNGNVSHLNLVLSFINTAPAFIDFVTLNALDMSFVNIAA